MQSKVMAFVTELVYAIIIAKHMKNEADRAINAKLDRPALINKV